MARQSRGTAPGTPQLARMDPASCHWDLAMPVASDRIAGAKNPLQTERGQGRSVYHKYTGCVMKIQVRYKTPRRISECPVSSESRHCNAAHTAQSSDRPTPQAIQSFTHLDVTLVHSSSGPSSSNPKYGTDAGSARGVLHSVNYAIASFGCQRSYRI